MDGGTPLSERLAAASDEEVMRLYTKMLVCKEDRIAAELRALSPEARKLRFVQLEIPDDMRQRLRVRWEDVWARPNQLSPPDDAAPSGKWSTWLALAGRGFGKTEAGAQWVRQRVRDGARHIAIIAETQKDLEEVMVSRLLSIYPPDEAPRVRYKPVRILWPNGAMALGYNGTEPDQLRGPEFDTAWVDELAKYACARETWDMLQFTMRRGEDPRVFVTTTPRPIPIIKEIVADPTTAVTRGKTMDNAANLSKDFMAKTVAKYAGTRLGRQELDAEILDDVPGALWTREILDEHRVEEPPDLARIVVAVDPSGTHGEAEEEANEVGIIVVGLGLHDARGYVLADYTCNLSPEGWARKVAWAYHHHQADRVVAETNFGGAMVGSLIKSVDVNIPFSEVKASRGKVARAEPVSALYEQGRVSHVGALTKLEDQMMLLTGAGFAGEGSPDRVDAVVWGLTDIMINTKPIFTTAVPEFEIPPFPLPPFWPRAFAMKVEPGRTLALWAAYDTGQRALYITTEHVRAGADPAVNVAAIKARGEWIPGIIDSDETKLEARREMAQFYAAHGLELVLGDRAFEAGINDVNGLISTGRLKVFSSCQGVFRDYRAYRRDEDGAIVGGGFMDCLRLLCRPGTIAAMRTKPKTEMVRMPINSGQGSHRGDMRTGY